MVLAILVVLVSSSPQGRSTATEAVLKAELSYRASASVMQDPFYSLPEDAGLASAAPGTLFKHPVKGLPVVVWVHGTSGVNIECVPSNIQKLWHHFQAPYTLALNGYVVVTTDYAELGVNKYFLGRHIAHEYLTGPAQANDVVYSVPAVRAAFPELSKEFVLLGSSQGGLAVWASAEKLAVNPMEGYLGTISLSPVTRIFDLPDSTGKLSTLMMQLIPGLLSKYPDFDPAEVLNAQGVDNYNTYMQFGGCNAVAFNLPNGAALNPNWRSNPTLLKYEQHASPGRKAFAGPMLVMEGAIDPVVYPPSVVNSVTDTARLYPNSSLEFHLLPDVSHAPAMYSGAQVYSEWIRQRFEGIMASPRFRNSSADIVPVRPRMAQQIEANWYIQNFTAAWQLT